MRIISCKAENFGSYKELEFDFINQGLTLIQGATGSGKSTLCDLIPWVLFGTTAKGGKVTDVISWNTDGVERTSGRVLIEVNGNRFNIYRSRGTDARENDLCYFVEPPLPGLRSRGKDLQDTQKLINNLLGINADLYLAGAYFHEFSQTAQFFTTTAKNRRAICEQLVDLTLANTLAEKIKEDRKTYNDLLGINQEEQAITESDIKLLSRHQEQESARASDWEKSHEKTKAYVVLQHEKFESNRKKTISKKCNSCGTQLEHPREVIDTSENPYITRLAELEKETNPHLGSVKDFSNEIATNKEYLTILKDKESELNLVLSDLETLQDVVTNYRSISIQNTILALETTTNKYLEENFDAEIKVVFSATDADKLEVFILKDSNEASYTQLSKGQRCLLKLCFGVSVMKAVQDFHGVKFSQVFFDEALDGLDEVMKSKAYRLLSTLSQEYESIFVVEHSEGLKALFTNKYTVELINGESQIEQV